MKLTRRKFIKAVAVGVMAPILVNAKPIGDGKPLYSTAHKNWPKYEQIDIPENAAELLDALNQLFIPAKALKEPTYFEAATYGMKWAAQDDLESGRYVMEKKATRALWFTAVSHYQLGKRAILIRRNPAVVHDVKSDFLILKVRCAFA